MPGAFEDHAHHRLHVGFVVDHEYGVLHAPTFSVVIHGNCMTKRAPRCNGGNASRRPPLASVSVKAMVRPRPVPWSLVVKNGSNKRGMISGGMPGPLSWRMSRTRPSSTCVDNHSSPLLLPMAS